MRWFVLIFVMFLAGCAHKTDHRWLGYAEGDYIYVSAPQAGWIVNLYVKRGEQVKPGEKLFNLDDTYQVAMLNQAKAQIAEAKSQVSQAHANLKLTREELKRAQALLPIGGASRRDYDLAETKYETALAQVAQFTANQNVARAAFSAAQYQLSQREVVSRTNGTVQDIYFRKGEYAPAMTPVIEVLPPVNIYVRFFVPERDFARLHLGKNVLISCDACAKAIKARITFIAKREEFTPPVIFSQESREKLVFEAEARAPGGLKLNPGQPVDVRPAQ